MLVFIRTSPDLGDLSEACCNGENRSGLLAFPGMPQVMHPGSVTLIGVYIVRDRGVSGAPRGVARIQHLRLRYDSQVRHRRLAARFDFNHGVRL